MHQPTERLCAEHDKRISLTEQAVMSLKNTNEGITTKLDLLLAINDKGRAAGRKAPNTCARY